MATSLHSLSHWLLPNARKSLIDRRLRTRGGVDSITTFSGKGPCFRDCTPLSCCTDSWLSVSASSSVQHFSFSYRLHCFQSQPYFLLFGWLCMALAQMQETVYFHEFALIVLRRSPSAMLLGSADPLLSAYSFCLSLARASLSLNRCCHSASVTLLVGMWSSGNMWPWRVLLVIILSLYRLLCGSWKENRSVLSSNLFLPDLQFVWFWE